MNFFSFLADIFLAEMKNIIGVSKLMKLQPRKLLELFYKNPQEFAKKLGEMDVRARKVFTESVKKAQTELLSQPLSIKKAVEAQVSKIESITKKFITPEEKKVIEKKTEEAAKKGADFALLSSSWIVSGQWNPLTTGDVGDLTITTKTGDSYTYPGVSLKVWEAMKAAKGRNGSGAGTVFWALYLRAFKGSPFGQLQAKVFKLAGVKSMSPTDVKKMAKRR